MFKTVHVYHNLDALTHIIFIQHGYFGPVEVSDNRLKRLAYYFRIWIKVN